MSRPRRGKAPLRIGTEGLSDLAAETRALAERLDANVRANPERLSVSMLNAVAVQVLRNQQAILDALSKLVRESEGTVAEALAAPTTKEREPEAKAPAHTPAAPVAPAEPLVPRDGAAPSTGVAAGVAVPMERPILAGGVLEGDRARAAVTEFDNRDRSFDRGLEKLNSWLSGGRNGLPFQLREEHAYLNYEISEAMRSRIETELMGREGYGTRLGKLVIEGLKGEVVIYAKVRESGVASDRES